MENIRIESDKVTIFNSGVLETDFFVYAQNFYHAAKYVINHLATTVADRHDIAKLDLWYYAMVYLYRHSLELLLKACIFQTITSNTERKAVIGKIRHDLKQAFEKLIEVKGLKIDNNKNADWLMKYLIDISQFDRESDRFRYPFGNNFSASFEQQTHISLEATYENMNKAYAIIKKIYDTGTFGEDEYKAFDSQLIIESGSYYQMSVVGYEDYKQSFTPHFRSFKEVGHFLKIVVFTEEANLFMPMCYLYRNAVELGLKRLIFENSHIEISAALKIIRTKKHSILGLWNKIVDEIKRYTPDNDTSLKDVCLDIKRFHDLDPNSDLFRYPCNKKMEPYFMKKTI